MMQVSSLRKRNVSSYKDCSKNENYSEEQIEQDFKKDILDEECTLMEQLFLLSFEGDKSTNIFWNVLLSQGLRGCILIDLCLRNRLDINQSASSVKRLSRRTIFVKSDESTGDPILDEALKHIQSQNTPDTVKNWINHLSGYSSSFSKLNFHLKNVQDRLAKSLVGSGVLRKERTDFYFFEVETDHIVKREGRNELNGAIQGALLSGYDVHQISPRLLSLIMMANASYVLENALSTLEDDDDHERAARWAQELSERDFKAAWKKTGSHGLMWAVFDAFQAATIHFPWIR